MKRITITYHMDKPGVSSETRITIPMCDEAAGALYDWDRGETGTEARTVYAFANRLCYLLAGLAGYDKGSYVCSELAATQYKEAE